MARKDIFKHDIQGNGSVPGRTWCLWANQDARHTNDPVLAIGHVVRQNRRTLTYTTCYKMPCVRDLRRPVQPFATRRHCRSKGERDRGGASRDTQLVWLTHYDTSRIHGFTRRVAFFVDSHQQHARARSFRMTHGEQAQRDANH